MVVNIIVTTFTSPERYLGTHLRLGGPWSPANYIFDFHFRPDARLNLGPTCVTWWQTGWWTYNHHTTYIHTITQQHAYNHIIKYIQSHNNIHTITQHAYNHITKYIQSHINIHTITQKHNTITQQHTYNHTSTCIQSHNNVHTITQQHAYNHITTYIQSHVITRHTCAYLHSDIHMHTYKQTTTYILVNVERKRERQANRGKICRYFIKDRESQRQRDGEMER